MSIYDQGDRDRGGLSKADREYLLGRKEYSNEQTERNVRSRIRKRLRNTLLDLSFALEVLPDHDRQLVFAPANEESRTRVPEGIVGTIGFLYAGTSESTAYDFDRLLLEGINRTETDRGYYADVEISINRRVLEHDDIRDRMDEGEELPIVAIQALLEEGDIDIDDMMEYLDEQREAGEGENNA